MEEWFTGMESETKFKLEMGNIPDDLITDYDQAYFLAHMIEIPGDIFPASQSASFETPLERYPKKQKISDLERSAPLPVHAPEPLHLAVPTASRDSLPFTGAQGGAKQRWQPLGDERWSRVVGRERAERSVGRSHDVWKEKGLLNLGKG